MEYNNPAPASDGGGHGAIIAVIVLVVIVIVGYLAFRQGYLGGEKDNTQDIEINLPGGSPQP